MFSGAIIVLICGVAFINADSIPSYIHICKRYDPELPKCIKQSINFVRPQLIKGMKELDVPATDPFHVPNFSIPMGEGENPGVVAFDNVRAVGGTAFEIKKLQMDVSKLVIRTSVLIPELHVTGNFDLDMPAMKRKGSFSTNATKCVGSAVLHCEVKEVKGVKHLHFNGVDVKVKIGKASIRVDDIVGADPAFVATINDMIEQNSEEYLKLATPHLQAKASEGIKKLANKISKHFDYDEAFPEK